MMVVTCILRCMGVNGPATPRASALGIELRKLREANNLGLRELAENIGVHFTTLSRWETGSRFPRSEDVALILGRLGVTDGRRDDLIELARNVDRPQWLSLGSTQQQRQLATLLEFEGSATTITCVAPLLIPGLLQTAGYARAIMKTGGFTDDEVEIRVAVRMGRRDVLARSGKPMMRALIGEAALRTAIGGHEVMAEQLATLQDMADWESVDLRVIPIAAGWHPGLMGPFVMVERADGDPVVHIETLDSGLFLHEPKDTVSYRRAADMVLRSAMSQADSRKLIADIRYTLDDRREPA
jgi:transcriptional regulator with XRE-family HTH domain